MQIAKDKVVAIDYTLKDDDGSVLDTSEGKEPLAYLHGSGNIIPGLEKALEGKAEGEEVSVNIPPEEAYGERREDLTQVVPRNMFQGVDELQVGMQFQAQSEGGEQIVTIAAIEGDDVTVDANHPMAGVPLNFDVKVVEVRDATEEEKEHGHAH
ncbi:FKBP-type peptidyl-prolyl cis-trans isomerase [Aquisalimonas asiatica]|uniref:Peptidyl-prolyl cis-trans isomerase n=1 Tax=Aquisalimonas asiatica TaxID=406100 RepID=A0A1H8RMW3_9GAMM|nr:peptidylprolyl isomerase [Aquisalimonas asiatica]SEO67672.1 FKBP-type peptidyl-prolyl cis-trans isomerase SlyD [Aquisalimonas asiatica]